jgi:hypothetical protein
MTETMELTTKAREIYKARLEQELEAAHKGRIVAIEVESGDYFLGHSEIEAYEKACEKHPGKKFGFLRVGARTTHFVGAF